MKYRDPEFEIKKNRAGELEIIRDEDEIDRLDRDSEYLLNALHRLALSRQKKDIRTEHEGKDLVEFLLGLQKDMTSLWKYLEEFKQLKLGWKDDNSRQKKIKELKFYAEHDVPKMMMIMRKIEDKDEAYLRSLKLHITKTPWTYDDTRNKMKKLFGKLRSLIYAAKANIDGLLKSKAEFLR